MSTTLTETWYKEGKSSEADEVVQIIKATAKLIKNEIKNYENQANFCLGIDDITILFFYLDFLSRAFTIHRAAGS